MERLKIDLGSRKGIFWKDNPHLYKLLKKRGRRAERTSSKQFILFLWTYLEDCQERVLDSIQARHRSRNGFYLFGCRLLDGGVGVQAGVQSSQSCNVAGALVDLQLVTSLTQSALLQRGRLKAWSRQGKSRCVVWWLWRGSSMGKQRAETKAKSIWISWWVMCDRTLINQAGYGASNVLGEWWRRG